jgi:hypothetical protein
LEEAVWRSVTSESFVVLGITCQDILPPQLGWLYVLKVRRGSHGGGGIKEPYKKRLAQLEEQRVHEVRTEAPPHDRRVSLKRCRRPSNESQDGFVGARIGRGKNMSADKVAFDRVFGALEQTYGKGIFTLRMNGEIDVALQDEDENKFVLTISVDIPREKVEGFNGAVIRELNRAGLKTSSESSAKSSGKPKSWWKFW